MLINLKRDHNDDTGDLLEYDELPFTPNLLPTLFMQYMKGIAYQR